MVRTLIGSGERFRRRDSLCHPFAVENQNDDRISSRAPLYEVWTWKRHGNGRRLQFRWAWNTSDPGYAVSARITPKASAPFCTETITPSDRKISAGISCDALVPENAHLGERHRRSDRYSAQPRHIARSRPGKPVEAIQSSDSGRLTTRTSRLEKTRLRVL